MTSKAAAKVDFVDTSPPTNMGNRRPVKHANIHRAPDRIYFLAHTDENFFHRFKWNLAQGRTVSGYPTVLCRMIDRPALLVLRAGHFHPTEKSAVCGLAQPNYRKRNGVETAASSTSRICRVRVNSLFLIHRGNDGRGRRFPSEMWMPILCRTSGDESNNIAIVVRDCRNRSKGRVSAFSKDLHTIT